MSIDMRFPKRWARRGLKGLSVGGREALREREGGKETENRGVGRRLATWLHSGKDWEG